MSRQSALKAIQQALEAETIHGDRSDFAATDPLTALKKNMCAKLVEYAKRKYDRLGGMEARRMVALDAGISTQRASQMLSYHLDKFELEELLAVFLKLSKTDEDIKSSLARIILAP